MHPFFTSWKYQKTLQFSDAFKELGMGTLGANGLS